MSKLTLKKLQQAIISCAAIRRVARLQPAGGEGDKVFPPTYEGGEYALEKRVLGGERTPCVLLDSVQSQANRIEEALLAAHRAERINIPVVSVDFGAEGLPEVGTITSLDAPHRLADAILRDSLVDGVPFRESPVGCVLDTATTSNATGLFEQCPTALVFGVWDSAGPKGGLGTKFARALVSEIVAVDAEIGVRPSSRLDPLGIEVAAGPVFVGDQAQWTLDAKVGKKKKWKEGKPSQVNHGNVTPSLKDDKGHPHHGGATFVWARHCSVLSLAGLRRLSFPNEDGVASSDRDRAAQVVLSALALAGVALSTEMGTDLRSRCALVIEPGSAAVWTLVGIDGVEEEMSLSADDACALLRSALKDARKAGLPWSEAGTTATPNKDLVELVRRSRDKTSRAGAEG